MREGYILAYVDFFYITTHSTPSEIDPHPTLIEEYE